MQRQLEQLMELFESLKKNIRQKDPHLYERWKVGGFIVDTNIFSDYPNLSEVVEQLDSTEEE